MHKTVEKCPLISYLPNVEISLFDCSIPPFYDLTVVVKVLTPSDVNHRWSQGRQISILSAYSNRDRNSKVGKMKWLRKNTKFKRANIHLVMRSEKQIYAMTDGKPNVLIDDYIKNIREWEAKGGIGIHHTNVGKTIGELKRLGFK